MPTSASPSPCSSTSPATIYRHDLAVKVIPLPLSQCPKEVAYLRARKGRLKATLSHAMKHRLELLQQLPPPNTQEQEEIQEASLLLDDDNADDSGADGAGDGPGGGDGGKYQPTGATQDSHAQGALGATTDTSASRAASLPPKTSSTGPSPFRTATHKQIVGATQDSKATLRLKNLDAERLARSLEDEAQGRCYDHMITFTPPTGGPGAAKVAAVRRLLDQGLQRGKSQQQTSSAHVSPVEACMSTLVQALKRKGSMEAEIEEPLTMLLNAVAAQTTSKTPQKQDGTTWKVGLPDQGPALFAKHGTSIMAQDSPKAPMRDKPDIVGLIAAQNVTQSFHANTADVCTWVEVKREASADLSWATFRQVLRYEYRRVIANAAVGFSCGLTLCGRKLRVWRFDSLGYTTSRALDMLDAGDLDDIAAALTFVTGPATSLTEQWQPVAGVDYLFEMEGKRGQAEPTMVYKVVFKEAPEELNDPSLGGLFGRRTIVWGGVAALLQRGTIVNGSFRADPAHAPRVNVSIVTKTAWLPEYLKWHEHRVLVRLEDREVADVPLSLGLLQESSAGLPAPTHVRHIGHLTAQSDRLESRALQLQFCVMLQEAELGIILPLDTGSFGRYARMCALWAILLILSKVSEAGVHYRDLNRGNILLRRNWQEMIEKGDRRIAILIDFGNSRVDDQRRGDADSPHVRDLPTGIDDVMSVNAMFLTTNAMVCAKLQERRKKCLDGIRRGVDVDKARAQLKRTEEELARGDHRYIDDIEATLYCWLYHNLLNPDADATWVHDLDDAIFEKSREPSLWKDEDAFWSCVREPDLKNSVIDSSVAEVLEKIRSTTESAQEELRKPANAHLRTVAISSTEQETYATCLGAIEGWLDASMQDEAESSVTAESSNAQLPVEDPELSPYVIRSRRMAVRLDGPLDHETHTSPSGVERAMGGPSSSSAISPTGRVPFDGAAHTPKTPSNLRWVQSAGDLVLRVDQAVSLLAASRTALYSHAMEPASPASPTKPSGPNTGELTTVPGCLLRQSALHDSGEGNAIAGPSRLGQAGPSASSEAGPSDASSTLVTGTSNRARKRAAGPGPPPRQQPKRKCKGNSESEDKERSTEAKGQAKSQPSSSKRQTRR